MTHEDEMELQFMSEIVRYSQTLPQEAMQRALWWAVSRFCSAPGSVRSILADMETLTNQNETPATPGESQAPE